MSIACKNKPAKPVKSKIETVMTDFGTWRNHDFGGGRKFGEFRSHTEVMDRPLLSIAWGMDPETERMATARGFIAIGQRASGFIAIGQFVNGWLACGQFASGRIAAVGQFVVAPLAVGQFALALAAVAQMGAAGWGVFQSGAVFFDGIGQAIYRILG